MWYDKLIENNRLPDSLLRIGIRKLLKKRLDDETIGCEDQQQQEN
jgi:cyclopropane-fatty-acyl-phospholipid synthase